MEALERLERAKGGPFTYRHRGEVRGLPSPALMHAGRIMQILRDGGAALAMDMPLWKSDLLLAGWVAHHDLPEVRDAERLWYLLSRYDRSIESDLRVYTTGADLGDLWRTRRWRLLLNLIDHLPGHSHYSAAVANDVEHAEMLAKVLADRAANGEETPKSGPSLTHWTPEVNVIVELIDEVKALRHTFIVANSEKGKTPKPPAPHPRPISAMAAAHKKAEHARRLSSHRGLAARLLPHKYDSNALEVDRPLPTPDPVGQPSPGTAFLRRKALSGKV